MRNLRVVALLLCLAQAAALSSQTWRGSAGLEFRVTSKRGPVAGAEIVLEYREDARGLGPAAATTDSRGRATFGGLANGLWQVEIGHADFLSYVAVVAVSAGDKPDVTASFLEASGDSIEPIRVKVSRARNAPPSPPSAASLAQPPSVSPAPEGTPPPRPSPEAVPPPVEVAERIDPEPPESEAPASEAQELDEPEPEAPVAEPEPPVEESAEPEPPAREAPEADPPAATAPAPQAPESGAPPSEVPGLDEPPSTTPAPGTAEAEVVDAPAAQPEPEAAVSPPAPVEEPEPPAEKGVGAEATVTAPTLVAPPASYRAYSNRTCVECRPGEWAVTVAAAAGNATRKAGCAEPDSGAFRRGLGRLAGSAELELSGFTGSLAGALPEVAAARREGIASDLGSAESAGGCRVVGVVLPVGARFVGFQYFASEGDTPLPCLPDEPCEIGEARWLGTPTIQRGASATVIAGIFQNEAARDRVAHMIVYFRPPSSSWEPPAP